VTGEAAKDSFQVSQTAKARSGCRVQSLRKDLAAHCWLAKQTETSQSSEACTISSRLASNSLRRPG
jgi:hypothetical protein